MAGLCGYSYLGQTAPIDPAALAATLDPLELGKTSWVGDAHHRIATSHVAPPRPGSAIRVEDGDFAGAVFGELTHPAFDTALVHQLMSDEAAAVAAKMRGTFGIAILCRRTGRVRLISDRTSQQPLYWCQLPDGFVWASTLAVFCQLPDAPQFAPDWLYEFLYFNYPLGGLTCLKGVRRMPAATILELDPTKGTSSAHEYAELHACPAQLLDAEASIEQGNEVLAKVVARTVPVPSAAIIALTSGMDSRTILAFLPPASLADIVSCTYGQPGCLDVEAGARIAASLKIPFHALDLAEDFRAGLPDLCWWTVFLSGGLQTILRATLPYAYANLSRHYPDRSCLLHGAAGDHLFRDHINGSGNRPHILTGAFQEAIRTGRVTMDETEARSLFGQRYEGFRGRIESSVERLISEYGPAGSAETYARILVYEAGPKYFAGEAAIANHWYAVQRPFMDADSTDLAFSTEFGVVAMSRRTEHQQRYRERYFQARLIGMSSNTAALPLYSRPISAFYPRFPWRYHLHTLRQVPSRLRARMGKPRPQLEDWAGWFAGELAAPLARLLGRDSRLADYINPAAINRALASGEIHLLGRLATAEILLRLIESRWQMPEGVRPLLGSQDMGRTRARR